MKTKFLIFIIVISFLHVLLGFMFEEYNVFWTDRWDIVISWLTLQGRY